MLGCSSGHLQMAFTWHSAILMKDVLVLLLSILLEPLLLLLRVVISPLLYQVILWELRLVVSSKSVALTRCHLGVLIEVVFIDSWSRSMMTCNPWYRTMMTCLYGTLHINIRSILRWPNSRYRVWHSIFFTLVPHAQLLLTFNQNLVHVTIAQMLLLQSWIGRDKIIQNPPTRLVNMCVIRHVKPLLLWFTYLKQVCLLPGSSLLKSLDSLLPIGTKVFILLLVFSLQSGYVIHPNDDARIDMHVCHWELLLHHCDPIKSSACSHL